MLFVQFFTPFEKEFARRLLTAPFVVMVTGAALLFWLNRLGQAANIFQRWLGNADSDATRQTVA